MQYGLPVHDLTARIRKQWFSHLSSAVHTQMLPSGVFVPTILHSLEVFHICDTTTTQIYLEIEIIKIKGILNLDQSEYKAPQWFCATD